MSCKVACVMIVQMLCIAKRCCCADEHVIMTTESVFSCAVPHD